MDTSEIHFLSFDPGEIYSQMQQAYVDAGGDVLYPGDEKEMLLRAVQTIVVQALAYIDNRLRMATLRYAEEAYLDIIGEDRDCPRLAADYARAIIEIALESTGRSGIIAKGTYVTADGEALYAIDEDVTISGYAQTIRVGVTARDIGHAGNGLTEGTQMQFQNRMDGIQSVTCVVSASGGQDEEDDDTYRERIREHGLANTTTGPRAQYEATAKAVTSEILDVRATTLGAGRVGVYLLLEDSAGAEAIKGNVRNALSDTNVRPLTDSVEVYEAEEIPYLLALKYQADDGSNISQAVAEAISSYSNWQDNTIGRAFNPDRLMADVYHAGARRVVFGSESHFNHGAAEYTEIPPTSRLKGEITLEELP